jgi:adenylate cyclase
MASDPKGFFSGFRLKVSFLSVLALIQVLLVGLSATFTWIIVGSLKHWENRKADTVAKFVESEANHGTSRVSLAVLAMAENKEVARLFASGDREGLLKNVEPLWKDMQTHGLEQFEFSAPSPRGMVSFLRVHSPGEFGELNSAFRPLIVQCDEDKKLVHGLEQGRTGYAFRAAAPVFYQGKYAGCVEFGSGLHTGFLKRLNETQPGTWSIVNLERGIEVHGGDKSIIGTYNLSDEQALAASDAAPAEALKEVRAGKYYRASDSKNETVSLYIPVRNFKGDVAVYLRHDFDTNFYKNIRKAIATSVGICLIGLLLSGLVIIALYRQITGPINGLVEETEKIRSFELDEPVTVTARLKEIQKLVTAITSMKTGLVSFKKYVPAQLVRELIEANQEAKISGERRELTMLFSDIADFTSISEALKPKELTAQLSEYLNATTEIIMNEHGTVDKYIGDAVMAFWGAPLAHPKHAAAACRAALLAQKKIEEMNAVWAAQGRPTFHTRIGINTGEVIVGNMGSEQRLNYTVIGDPVNLASRLEGINKNYKTRIIISQNTYDRCKDDVEVRILDFATVKGKAEVVTIYELLAEKGDISTVDREFALQFTAAVQLYRDKKWDQAIEKFTQLSRKRPDDYPAVMFLRRCHGFKAQPPEENWAGVAA